MSYEVNMRNIGEFLRGQGFPEAAETIEASDPTDGPARLAALHAALDQIPEGNEARLVVESMAAVIRQGLGLGGS